MSKDNSALSRRKVLRTIGAGTLSLGAASTATAKSSISPEVVELTGKDKKEAVKRAKKTEKFGKLKKEAKKKGLKLGEQKVYLVNRENKYKIVSTPLTSNEAGIDGDITLVLRPEKKIEGAVRIREKVSETKWEMEQINVTKTGVNKESATAEANLNEDGTLESSEIRTDGSSAEEIASIDQVTPQVQVGCSACKEVYDALCQVGCSATTGVVCTIVTGGIGAVVCGVAMTLICSYTAVPANCTYSAPDVMTPEGACKAVGSC